MGDMVHKVLRRGVGSLIPLLLVSAGACAEAPSSVTLEPCRLPGLDDESLCAEVRVLEDRKADDGRAIDLHVVVLPARRPGKTAPVFFLQGGPGAAATQSASRLAQSPLREHHDLVLVDQRGTGGSNALDCGRGDLTERLRLFFEGDAVGVAGCVESLDADPRYYTAVEAMQDLDEVRAALGYERINLWGASYGSLEAFEYLRRYPERVRAVALQGVAPPSLFGSLTVATTAQRALDLTLSACEEDPGCHSAFPRVREELDAVLGRLAKSSVPSEVRHPTTGERLTVQVSRDLFAGVLRFLLYDTRLAARVPAAIHAAHEGDFEGIVQFAVRFADQLGGLIHGGAALSAFCSEDVTRFSKEQIEMASKGSFLGARLVLNLKRACDDWPTEDLPEDFYAPVSFDGPALLVSGDLDPVTPAGWAAQAAEHLPRSRHVIIAEAAHALGPLSCIHDILARFFDAGSVEGLDTSCVERIRRPAFVLPR